MTPCAFVLIKTKPNLTSVHPTMCVFVIEVNELKILNAAQIVDGGLCFLDKKFSTVSKSRSRELRNSQQFQNSSLDNYLRLVLLKFQVSVFDMVLIESLDLDSFNKIPFMWHFYKHVF
jgi:hypothetical protein